MSVAGLAYYISMKDPELAPRIPMLKDMYEEQFKLAAEEDRVKTPARFVPKNRLCLIASLLQNVLSQNVIVDSSTSYAN